MYYPKKPVRQSQLISPWGVGAIVPFPDDESIMIAGLDMWEFGNDRNEFVIRDSRLEKRLGVDELRYPPDFHDPSAGKINALLKIPGVRFPLWSYCPNCGSMQKSTYFAKQAHCNQYKWTYGRDCSSFKYPRKLIPERFIVICPEGHIDDFPVMEWVHYGKPYDPHACKVRRSTGGKSASLAGVTYECTCGAKRSLAGATIPGALANAGYKCRGSKPWLGIEADDEHPCGNTDVKVVQRGGTNVWFADMKSSIYIPIEADENAQRLQTVAEEVYKKLGSSRTNGQIDEEMVKFAAEMKHVDADSLYEAVVAISNNEKIYSEVSEDISEEEFRIAEYNVLNKSSGNDTAEFHSVNHDISHFNKKISSFFSNISLVKKLRETRAFVGFSRLEPDETKPLSVKKKELRLGNENWLPAIQVFGEGIFFNFNKQYLDDWSQRSDIQSRMRSMDRSYLKNKDNPGLILNPKFVLIHTFAHLIINQLSYNCGYGSSSIRERVYCDKFSDKYDMYGVLLYTASGDSEGSLGGLVRQGDPGLIEPTLITAISNAEWCSSDPVCIQSSGQGPDNSNLAACHNCALLPETCCENGNRLLDRGLLIGTIENRKMGYFYDLIQH